MNCERPQEKDAVSYTYETQGIYSFPRDWEIVLRSIMQMYVVWV